MPQRMGAAVWEGGLEGGKGQVKLGSGAFDGNYTFASRFEEGQGTSPEELIGAAHAGCFAMALSATLELAGHNPRCIRTTAKVHLNQTDEGSRITLIELDAEAEVPDLDPSAFLTLAEAAKESCPVSQALTGSDITLTARLAP